MVTNKDLEKEVDAGQFRQDLFYRINLLPIVIPPLRERRDDIPLLAEWIEAQREQGIEPEIPEAIEQAAALHVGETFRRVSRGRHQPPPASRADDDGFHFKWVRQLMKHAGHLIGK
mgnify:CR=1 FL=1